MPNGKLLALVLAFAAVGGLVATGAFTSVEADRTAGVQVDGDANALLSLEPTNNTVGENATNNFVTSDTGSSQLAIDLSNDALNANATTDAGAIINVTNSGDETASLSVVPQEVSNNVEVEFYAADVTGAGGTSLASVMNNQGVSDLTSSSILGNEEVITDSENNEITINPGETVRVGMVVQIGDISISDPDQVIFGGVSFLADEGAGDFNDNS